MANDKAKPEKNNLKKDLDLNVNQDYSLLSKNELHNIAKELSLKGFSQLNKAGLQKLIEDKIKKEEDKIPEYKKSPLNDKTKEDLVQIAKELGIKNYSRLSKMRLIKDIEEYTSEKNQEENMENKENEKPLNFFERSKRALKNVLGIEDTIIEEKKEDIQQEIPFVTETPILEEEPKEDLSALPVASLVNIAKDLKIKGYSRLNKSKLIKSISEIKNSISDKAEEIKGSINQSVDSFTESFTEKTDAINKSLENLEESLNKTKEIVTHVVSEMKDAFNRDNEITDNKEISLIETIEKDSNLEENKKTKKKAKVKLDSKKKDSLSKDNEIKNILEDEELINKTEDEKLKVKEQPTSAENIEKIALGLESPYIDKRDTEEIENEIKNSFLLKPSKFGFGKTNDMFILKDEENVELPKLYEEDKITLLPVDPTKMFIYWDLASETINYFIDNKIKDFYIRVNDVTGIIYDGFNANLYWLEKCHIEIGNWYIYLDQGGRNFCVELGYINNGNFNVINRSNTVMVASGRASEIISDTFVISNFPQVKNIIPVNSHDSKEYANDKYIIKNVIKKDTPYYELNDYKIADNYNLRKMAQKMPSFSIDYIDDHFIKEYSITGFQETPIQNEFLYNPPEKLSGEPPLVYMSNTTIEKIVKPSFVNENTEEKALFEEKNQFSEDINNDYQPIINVSEEAFNISEPLLKIQKDIPETIYSFFSSIPEFSKDKILVDSYYYELTGEPQKAMRVFYEWVENEIPYRKEIFWISDTLPQVHQNIYKVSWGPSWTKEFIGGSEQIKYLGASERFIGGSEVFLGGSEYFIESSGRYMGSSDIYGGNKDKYLGSSEIMIGGSENYMEFENKFSGASENYQSIEIKNTSSDEFIIKNNRPRVQDYKGIKDRYKL